jgi:hypothetical protein
MEVEEATIYFNVSHLPLKRFSIDFLFIYFIYLFIDLFQQYLKSESLHCVNLLGVLLIRVFHRNVSFDFSGSGI